MAKRKDDTQNAGKLLLSLHAFRACNWAISYNGAKKYGNTLASTKSFKKGFFHIHSLFLMEVTGFSQGGTKPFENYIDEGVGLFVFFLKSIDKMLYFRLTKKTI